MSTSKPKCGVCSGLARLPDFVTTQGDIPPPEPLDMHCCAVCSAAWCLQCLDRIDAKPSEARDCPSCHRGRVMEVPRLFVMACIPEGGRLPRCGCIRGMLVSVDAAREHEMHCQRFLMLVMQEIGALKQGATYTDPQTVNALIQLALAHPVP